LNVQRRNGVVASLGAAFLAVLAAGPVVRAQTAPPLPAQPATARQTLSFVGHGAFFSQETKRSPAIDPQVFVKDESSAEGTGPQSIAHAAGVRTVRLDDTPELVLYNANGDPLGFTLEKWLGATGTVDLDPQADGGTRLAMSFKKLIAFGVYSVFRATFSPDGTTFVAIDGDGTTNTFTSAVDGSGTLIVSMSSRLTHANAIVLLLHSDSQEHGVTRGLIGVNAHQQLVARLP
jgi:hypothetical protein